MTTTATPPVRGDILASDARQLTATLNRDLARPFIDLNFGPQQRYTRIALPIPQPADTAALSAALEKLVPLGLPVQASFVRDKLGIPDPQHGALLLAAPTQPASGSAAAAATLNRAAVAGTLRARNALVAACLPARQAASPP